MTATAHSRPRPARQDRHSAVRGSSTSGGLAARAAAARARREADGPVQPRPAARARRDADGAGVRPEPAPAKAPRGSPAARPSRRVGAAAPEAAARRPAHRRRPPATEERPTGSGRRAAAAAAARAPEHAPEAQRDLRLVEPRRRAAAPVRPRLILGGLSLLCVAAVFGLVALHVVSAEKQFAIDRLSQQEQQAQNTYEDLRLQVDQLYTPQHILSDAQKLGMVQPGKVTYLRVPGAAAVSGLSGNSGVPLGPADSTKMKSVLAGNP